MHKPTLFLLAISLALSQMVCNDECSKILGSTNQERAKAGKSALCINSALMLAAQKQAEYQSRIKKMTHTGEGGNTVGDRVTASGYQWAKVAENVAFGQATPRGVMLGWMNSPGHKTNILSDNTEMGIAHVGEYWSQVFGTPKRGSGGCNTGTVGGQLGMVEAIQLDVGPQCSGLCPSILQAINSNRASEGLAAVCVSPKLMAAASKVVSQGAQEYRGLVEATGFGAKAVGMATQTIRSSAGPPTDSDIISMFRANYRGSGADSSYTRVGISSDFRRENWYILLAGTFTPELDQCEGAAAISVLPVTPTATVAVSCASIRTPCECGGSCGWSSTSSQCVPGGVTDCTECALLPQCAAVATVKPTISCSQHQTPCQCVGLCGWSSGARVCLPASATTVTDCSECPSQPMCTEVRIPAAQATTSTAKGGKKKA